MVYSASAFHWVPEDIGYSKYYYKYYGIDIKSEKEYSEEKARQRTQIAEKYSFIDIKYALFYRTRTFFKNRRDNKSIRWFICTI